MPFSCKKCGKKFAKLKSLQAHEFKKIDCNVVLIHSCKYCDKTFDKKKRHTAHEKTHIKPFSCKYCENRFSFLSNQRIHEEKCVKPKKAPLIHSCKICGKEFTRAFMKRAHESRNNCGKLGELLQFEKISKEFPDFYSSAFKVLHGVKDSKTCKCGQKYAKNHKLNAHLRYYKTYQTKEKNANSLLKILG